MAYTWTDTHDTGVETTNFDLVNLGGGLGVFVYVTYDNSTGTYTLFGRSLDTTSGALVIGDVQTLYSDGTTNGIGYRPNVIATSPRNFMVAHEAQDEGSGPMVTYGTVNSNGTITAFLTEGLAGHPSSNTDRQGEWFGGVSISSNQLQSDILVAYFDDQNLCVRRIIINSDHDLTLDDPTIIDTEVYQPQGISLWYEASGGTGALSARLGGDEDSGGPYRASWTLARQASGVYQATQNTGAVPAYDTHIQSLGIGGDTTFWAATYTGPFVGPTSIALEHFNVTPGELQGLEISGSIPFDSNASAPPIAYALSVPSDPSQPDVACVTASNGTWVFTDNLMGYDGNDPEAVPQGDTNTTNVPTAGDGFNPPPSSVAMAAGNGGWIVATTGTYSAWLTFLTQDVPIGITAAYAGDRRRFLG